MLGARSSRAVAATLLVSAVVLGGCATRRPGSRFVLRKDRGSIDIGKGEALPTIDPDKYERARREALAARVAGRPAPLPSIEVADAALRQSLVVLGRAETASAHVRVAQDYWRLKVMDAAFDHFSDAIRLEPRNVTAWEGRAMVWRQWGMTALALSDVHRARYFGPDRPDVLNTLGTILEGAGQCSGAREAYAGALKLDPNADWARDNMARLEHVGPDCKALQM